MTHRGFTLMEAVIYIALFSVLMVGAMVATYQLLESGDRNQEAVSIQEEGTFLVRKITWALASATSASAVTPARLSITKLYGPDFPDADNPIVIDGSDGKTLTLARGGGSPSSLAGDGFTVSGFTVTTSGSPAHVHVEFLVNGLPFRFDIYLRQ